MITDTDGTAKTTLASYFTLACCLRHERVLYISFEESPDQLLRNMESVNIRLRPYVDFGHLIIHSSRPSLHGLEMHLLALNKYIREFKPRTVIIDPISSLVSVGSNNEVKAMLVRLIESLKTNGISALFSSLTRASSSEDSTEEAISSLADTWIKLRNEEYNRTIIRSLLIVKSRGMGHVGGLMDFNINSQGIKMLDPANNVVGNGMSNR